MTAGSTKELIDGLRKALYCKYEAAIREYHEYENELAHLDSLESKLRKTDSISKQKMEKPGGDPGAFGTGQSIVEKVGQALTDQYKSLAAIAAETGFSEAQVRGALRSRTIHPVVDHKKTTEKGRRLAYRLKRGAAFKVSSPQDRNGHVSTADAIVHVLSDCNAAMSAAEICEQAVPMLTKQKSPRKRVYAELNRLKKKARVHFDEGSKRYSLAKK